jgi:hypothetical protein
MPTGGVWLEYLVCDHVLGSETQESLVGADKRLKDPVMVASPWGASRKVSAAAETTD